MRSASVGFQCPECVAAGARDVRTPTTPFGGRVTAGGVGATRALVAVNVLVFLLGLVVPDLASRFGNVALVRGPDLASSAGVAAGQYYRLLTAAFLHSGIFHILFNMFALLQVGPVLERALGRSRFVALYLLSALGGSVAAYVFAGEAQLSVGASGAIFGMFGAYYVVVRKLGGDTGQIVLLLVVNVVLTFTIPNIDYRAHLGGLAAGAVLAAAFAAVPRGPRQGIWQAGITGTAVAALLVAVVVRTAVLT